MESWAGGLSNLEYFQVSLIHKSQFKKHIWNLLLHFSQHLSDYFEWDTVLDTLGYKHE